MNRELIIITVSIICVVFFYIQSDETSTAFHVEQGKQPITIQNDINETTKTVITDSLGR